MMRLWSGVINQRNASGDLLGACGGAITVPENRLPRTSFQTSHKTAFQSWHPKEATSCMSFYQQLSLHNKTALIDDVTHLRDGSQVEIAEIKLNSSINFRVVRRPGEQSVLPQNE